MGLTRDLFSLYGARMVDRLLAWLGSLFRPRAVCYEHSSRDIVRCLQLSGYNPRRRAGSAR